MQWLAGQGWAGDRIVLLGGSYAAFTAWAAAVVGQPAVRAVISLMPAMGLPQVTPSTRC